MNNQKPNILWICTDQQRFDTLGCYGNPFVKTPNIDKLAQNGVLFERAYCQSPVCAPSRASFLTGRYPRTCRLRQNGQNLPKDELLVTKLLADNGYICGLVGKLHLSVCSKPTCPVMEKRTDDGYAVFHWSHHPDAFSSKGNWPMNEYSNWLHLQGVEFKTRKFLDSDYVSGGMPVKYHHTTWCVNKAIEFIDTIGQSGAPWLFSVNLFDPHHAFDPPAEYLNHYIDILDDIPLPNYTEGELDSKSVFHRKDHTGAYDMPGHFAFNKMTHRDHKLIRAAYWAMIDNIDAQVGRLIQALEKNNQLDNTIIIFMSDHGEQLGDHGMYLKGPYFYEPSVHIPLIISNPKRFRKGVRVNSLVELTDIAPTLMETAGLAPAEGMQGKSLAGILTGEDSTPVRQDVYCEYYNSNINHTNPKAYSTMLFDGRYKIIKIHGDKEKIGVSGELYDLETDPTETINQWNNPEYSEVKTQMLENLCDRIAFTMDPLPIRQAQW